MTSSAASFVRAWAPPLRPAAADSVAAGIPPLSDGPTANFASEQIRSLVQLVFVPGWPRPAHQVLFSAVHESTHCAQLCLAVGYELAAKAGGRVCVVNVGDANRTFESFGGTTVEPGSVEDHSGEFRKFSRQISSNLWLMAESPFAGDRQISSTVGSVRGLLARLHMEFEYTILHAPPVTSSSETLLLGSLCDGIILLLEARRTRRAAAQRAKEAIMAANARFIGTVLCERDFPIPERIYRKL